MLGVVEWILILTLSQDIVVIEGFRSKQECVDNAAAFKKENVSGKAVCISRTHNSGLSTRP